MKKNSYNHFDKRGKFLGTLLPFIRRKLYGPNAHSKHQRDLKRTNWLTTNQEDEEVKFCPDEKEKPIPPDLSVESLTFKTTPPKGRTKSDSMTTKVATAITPMV